MAGVAAASGQLINQSIKLAGVKQAINQSEKSLSIKQVKTLRLELIDYAHLWSDANRLFEAISMEQVQTRQARHRICGCYRLQTDRACEGYFQYVRKLVLMRQRLD